MRTPRHTFAGAALALALAATGGGCTAASPGPEIGAGARPEPVELRVSAATSLRDVLEGAAPGFEAEHGVAIVFNFGSSGQLQKQIEGGAPADVFLSASPKQVDALVEAGLASAEDTLTFAGNDLVILVPRGNPEGIDGPDDLAGAGRVVTGNPDTAPHGTQAKEWLEGLGMWTALEPNLVFAENAAQTRDYVARGEAAAGIGFASEARGREDVEIAYVVPSQEIGPIRYVAVPLSAADQRETATAFIEFLESEESQERLVAAGFNAAPEQ